MEKTRLRTLNKRGTVYQALMFVCPGCAEGGPDGYDGLHLLSVNNTLEKPSWEWNEDLDAPTLSPSILTKGYCLCHSFLREGVFEFLPDSEHALAGQCVPIPELPQWALNLE